MGAAAGEDGQHGAWTQLVLLGLNVVAYLTLNSSLNLLNKYALGVYGFRFPFFLTASHMAFCFLALLPRELCRARSSSGSGGGPDPVRRQWRGLLGIGAFLACGISLNNISLMDISLSLNQVIRSSIPVVTCLLSMAVEGKVPSGLEASSLVVLSTGVMIAVWEGTVAGQPLGILFCCLGTLSSGLMVTFSGKLLSEKLNVLSLAFYTAPVSLLCLTPFFLIYELPQFRAYYAVNPQAVAMIVAISSANALAYNICHYMLIQRISGVATTVIGEVKIVGLMILSAALLGEAKQFTLKMSVGCAFALAGFCMFGHAKAAAYRQALQQEVVAEPDEETPLKLAAAGDDVLLAEKQRLAGGPAPPAGAKPWSIHAGR